MCLPMLLIQFGFLVPKDVLHFSGFNFFLLWLYPIWYFVFVVCIFMTSVFVFFSFFPPHWRHLVEVEFLHLPNVCGVYIHDFCICVFYSFLQWCGFAKGDLLHLLYKLWNHKELLTLPEHLNSPPVFSGIHVDWSLVLCVTFVDCCLSFCPFVLFLLTTVLSVLRFTDSDYPFGIFSLFLSKTR